ncbi:unnamed protein product [Gemmata massiliana]|uniref:Uncharacterized protein n=1 Tax=Gemmata massiliana TaxID=1210884 RepID=A0A6P2CYC1_9BACT|nr:hypothetical protein [Gemmata massiliana]VTR92794.1 unnamed protein product [Gemmata massiliana]
MHDNRPSHDGATFDRKFDLRRLNDQLRRVFAVMKDGQWRTLSEICAATGDMSQSVSARVRDFRKAKFGGFVVERRRRGQASRGLWEYRVIVPPELVIVNSSVPNLEA